MKINLMTDYAIRTIKFIAEDERGIVTSNAIAEEEEISHGVLMKVLRQLRVNDIVTSHQGRGEVTGGYSLNIPVNEITILRIIEIMEGPIEINFCANRKGLEAGQTNMVKNQSSLDIEYQRLSEVIRQEMSRYTIGELIEMEYSE